MPFFRGAEIFREGDLVTCRCVSKLFLVKTHFIYPGFVTNMSGGDRLLENVNSE
jgi:hypothetical protein